jgi:hypothetical protein
MKTGTMYAKLIYRENDLMEALANPHFSFQQKLRVIREDLAALAGCQRHAVDVLDLRDPGPTFRAAAELAPVLGASLRRAAHRLTAGWHWKPRPVKYVSQ